VLIDSFIKLTSDPRSVSKKFDSIFYFLRLFMDKIDPQSSHIQSHKDFSQESKKGGTHSCSESRENKLSRFERGEGYDEGSLGKHFFKRQRDTRTCYYWCSYKIRTRIDANSY